MKRSTYLLLMVFIFSLTAISGAEERRAESNQLFYTANHSYELRDYIKAAEGYAAILESGLESGNLYYNIGNSFLKMGRIGHAILFYERAKRLIPHDSDLKANLSYARSLVEGANDAPPGNIVINAINTMFELYSLRAIIFSATLLYLLLVLLVCALIVKPFFARRLRVIAFIIAGLFALNLLAAAIRYFDERILKHGIVLQKDVECKYEPIEKSTTYYTLHEGTGVMILNTRNGWRQIRRPDGKISWVKKEAVEKI